jgi:hypothetical protein
LLLELLLTAEPARCVTGWTVRFIASLASFELKWNMLLVLRTTFKFGLPQ